jgi:mRNA interferase MazF
MPRPEGSGPGFRRPVVVVQGDALNATGIGTVVVVPLTGNLRWASALGNVLLSSEGTGLPRDSVANASQTIAVDRELLEERVGQVTPAQLQQIFSGIDLVLGRN